MSAGLPLEIPFTAAAERLSTDHDVLMCYELLLGRDPENSFVIQESKTQPVRRVMEAFLRSDEFANNVAGPFRRGARIAHDSLSRGPNAEQIAWLTMMLRLPDKLVMSLRDACDWKTLFEPLSETLGLLVCPAPITSPPDDPLAALQARVDQLQAMLQQVNDAIPVLHAEMLRLATSQKR